LKEDGHVVTWALTLVELQSAVERRTQEGRLRPAGRRTALARFNDLASRWDEIVDVLAVRSRARALLARHALRAADAAQLAAALVLTEDAPSGAPFVCLDRGLAAAAEREGFEVLTWPDEEP
jgi:hypothetical protein